MAKGERDVVVDMPVDVPVDIPVVCLQGRSFTARVDLSLPNGS